MDRLTARQQEVLAIVTRHLETRGFPPTLREIAAELGIKGTLGVLKHLDALERKGFIRKSAGSSRGIVPAGPAAHAVPLPIAGTVRAGALTLAVEDIEGYVAVDRTRVRGEGCFFLRVRGDSMINAAIREGDLALVRPQQTAENRDIVVAMVEGEATLKRFYRERGRIRLQPENPTMEAIVLPPGATDVTIVGKVIGIYRELE